MIPDGENSADPRYRGCAPCVASFQLRRVSGGFVSSRVRCLRSAGRMRVCQIRIGRFRQGSGMLYLRNQIWDLQTGLAYRNGYGCFACRRFSKKQKRQPASRIFHRRIFAGSTVPSNGATSTRRIICIRSMPSSLVWKSRFL